MKVVKARYFQSLYEVAAAVNSVHTVEELLNTIVEKMAEAVEAKGCALMLLTRRSRKLEIAAAQGLSASYLNKGPLSSAKSIAESLKEGPVAIFNVRDDPRLQYPEEAAKEGIESIISVPLMLRGKALGCLRLYTAEPWEFTMADVNFVQAVALMLGLVLDSLRIAGAYKTSVEVLKMLRPVTRPSKRTLHE